MKNLNEFLMKLHEFIQNNLGYPTLCIIVIICIIIIYLAWYKFVRSQYSDEAWKIRKKNGKKSIFWYDEYGNEVYHRPKKSNPPNRKKKIR